MTSVSKMYAILIGLTLIGWSASAQKTKPTPAKQKPKTEQQQPKQKTPVTTSSPRKSGEAATTVSDAEAEKRVREIVSFLAYLLNTLGSSTTSIRDKDVVIRESYSKIFRDDKVQIEDDLENREVITNKDVVAYLKDVDFFFTDVRFEFNIESIQGGGTDNNKVFYKVALQRNMKGTTLDGEPVNSTIPRFIEVNYDPNADGLKIVSMYTHGFDEKAALTSWWQDLSLEWKVVFQRKLNISSDSLSFEQIKKAVSVDSLDLSSNLSVRTLEPLTHLSRLRYLNLASTTVSDLTPIRNLTTIVHLSLSGSSVKDLQPLRYVASMQYLNLAHTRVESLEALEKMPVLHSLDASHSRVADITYLSGLTELRRLSLHRTPVFDVTGLSSLQNLEHLDLAGSGVTDLTPLAGIQKLKKLNIDSTRIRDLRPLAGMTALEELSANFSRIDNLEPLKGITALRSVHCDQTQVVRSVADAFMAARPGVVVVYDSKDLKLWWDSLPPDWRLVLLPGIESPSKDDLARLTNLDSLSLRRYPKISALDPLKRVSKLRFIDLSGSAVTDLSPLRDLKNVVRLNISRTDVSDLGPIRFWTRLEVLKADSTRVQNLDPITSQTALKRVYVDNTGIHDMHAHDFLSRNNTCLLVYKTYHAQRWWSRLSPEWKGVFEALTKSASPGTEELHRLLELKAISITDVQVSEIGTLSEFVQLEDVRFSGTLIRDLTPVAAFTDLKVLHATNSPLKELAPISAMTWLGDLDVSGTPVDDLRELRRLTKLKRFSCAGTQVKKIDDLGGMTQLEYLDCSNTFVRSLDAVEHLPLKTIKCFNSRVSSREVEDLRAKGIDVVFYK